MDFFPSFNDFNKKIKNQQNQIVYTKFSADLDTPVSLMLKLATNEKNSFLLESVTGGEIKGRYSVFGMKPAHLMSEVAYKNAQVDLLVARYQLHKVLGLVNPLIK